jgi:hypothetical protein
MPVMGRQDLAAAAARAPLVRGLDTDAWELPGAEMLQLVYEIDGPAGEQSIPPALHPSIPPYATLTIARYPESPLGPFRLAYVRVVARVGGRPRGYLVGGFVDSRDIGTELAARWGYRLEVGDVDLQVLTHRITGEVRQGGETVLRLELGNPETISGADVSFLDGLHLVRLSEDGRESSLLVQVDPEYTFHHAQRGRPRVDSFRAEAFDPDGCLRLTDPVSGSFARVDTDLPRIRFVIDPTIPGGRSRRRLAA